MALLLAAVVAGLVLLAIARTAKEPAPWRLAAGWTMGLAAGIYAGCALLGEWPHWPPLEDRDRFLAVLLPLALAVEFAAMLLPERRALPWILRVFLAAAAAPILLHNSVYLADLAGPGSAEWSLSLAAVILSMSAAILSIVWGLLAELQSRQSGPTLSIVLAATALATAATVMLSGYFRGSLLALPMCGAIAGTTLASVVLPQQPQGNPCLGIGIFGIFSVLLIGRFFGSLPTSLAIGILLTPLLAWSAEIPRIRQWPVAARSAVGIAAVLASLLLMVACAQVRFNNSLRTGSETRR